MIIFGITFEDVLEESFFFALVLGITEDFTDAASVVPDLIIFLELQTDLSEVFHLFSKRQFELVK